MLHLLFGTKKPRVETATPYYTKDHTAPFVQRETERAAQLMQLQQRYIHR